MFGLRLSACLALLVAGCGGNDIPVDSQTSALDSCNNDIDCPLPPSHGTCVKAVCSSHACQYTTDLTACPSGCTVATQLADCNLGGTNCFIVKCTPGSAGGAGLCNFSDYSASSGCQCTAQPPLPGECTAPNNCQNAPTCNSATCTYTAKQPLTQPCCNITSDCGGTAVCAANTCACPSLSDKYCNGTMTGNGRCVPNAGCCVPADCTAGNACQQRTCSNAGVCGLKSNGNPGCCEPATVGTDCPAHANATVACTANTCVYTCNAGFHDCSGVCEDDTAVASCGMRCAACPAGNACQTPACSGGACGFVAAGASPCCNTTSNCMPANSCQTALACTNNMCSFHSTGASGCCDSATDCPTPADACLQAACVANQCATTPIAGCSDDGGMPPVAADLSTPVTPATPDLSAAVSLAGGGGCALAGAASAASSSSSRVPALVVALLLATLALRRRRA